LWTKTLVYDRRVFVVVASTLPYLHSSIGQHSQMGLYPLGFRILLRVFSMGSLRHAGGLVSSGFEYGGCRWKPS